MKRLPIYACLLAYAWTPSLFAQDALNSVLTETTDTKPYFAVFDVRPSAVSGDAVQEIVTAVFRNRFSGITVNQQIPPSPLPKTAPRMNFVQQKSIVGTINVPECPGASAVIKGTDKSMAQYGALSVVQACVFPYSDGLRVNVYAVYALKKGGANPVLWGAALGRMLTRAVGLGDSSQTIVKAIDDIETRLKDLAPTVALVDLSPRREDKPTEADPAQTPVPTQAETAPVAAPTGVAAAASAEIASPPPSLPAALAGLPPEQAQELQRHLALIGQIQRASAPQSQSPAAPSPAIVPASTTNTAIAARKELTAMGFSYFNQDQFVDAVQRGDRIACELFLQAGGVSLTKPNAGGLTPLRAATQPEIAALLADHQSKKSN